MHLPDRRRGASGPDPGIKPLSWCTWCALTRTALTCWKGQERALRAFARYLDGQAHDGPIPLESSLDWATSTSSSDPRNPARRLTVVRGFLRHLSALDGATEVPVPGLLGPTGYRKPPHVYSDDEIGDLLSCNEKSFTLGSISGIIRAWNSLLTSARSWSLFCGSAMTDPSRLGRRLSCGMPTGTAWPTSSRWPARQSHRLQVDQPVRGGWSCRFGEPGVDRTPTDGLLRGSGAYSRVDEGPSTGADRADPLVELRDARYR